MGFSNNSYNAFYQQENKYQVHILAVKGIAFCMPRQARLDARPPRLSLAMAGRHPVL